MEQRGHVFRIVFVVDVWCIVNYFEFGNTFIVVVVIFCC